MLAKGAAGAAAAAVLLVCSLPSCSTFFASPPALSSPALLVGGVGKRTGLARGLVPTPALFPVCFRPVVPGQWQRRSSRPPVWTDANVAALSQAASASDDASADQEEDEEEKAEAVRQAQAQAFFQAPGLTIRDISSMTVPQLKDELRERGLKVGGNKGELLQRLNDAIDGKIASPGPVKTSLGRDTSAATRSRSVRSSGAPSLTPKKTGGGLKLKEGERLPVAEPMAKRALDSTMKRIFVRGIPFRASPRDVAMTLEDAFGPVIKLEGMTLEGRATGRAWVTFENSEIAKAAVEEARIEMDNRPIFFSPPWSLAARQALREMSEVAAYDADVAGTNSAPSFGMQQPGAYNQGYDQRQQMPMTAPANEPDVGEEEDDERGGRTLFVGRVPLDAQEEDIRSALEEMGEVEKIFMGRVSQKNPASDFAGYAHVVMKDMAGITSAINTPITIRSQRVRVDRAVDGAKEAREERYPLEQQVRILTRLLLFVRVLSRLFLRKGCW
jgi:RNA recognition motif-containing protein